MAIRGYARESARNPCLTKNPLSHADFTEVEAAVFEAELLVTLSRSTGEVVFALLRVSARGLWNRRVFVSSIVALT